MPELIEATVTHREPTMAQLRDMVARTEPIEPKEPVEVEKTAEPEAPAKDAKEQNTEPVTAPGNDKQQEEAEEFELSESVRKKIEREAKKQAYFQSKIAHAVSGRKLAEHEYHEYQKSLDGKPGPEPAPTTEPTKDEPPELPDLATFPGTMSEFKVAQANALKGWKDWIQGKTREAVLKELQEQHTQETNRKAWSEATVRHGAEFQTLMKGLAEATPKDFQEAISALDDWSGVALYLAKHEAECAALVEKFQASKTSQLTAIAELGKLEDRLKPAVTPAEEKPPKELPRPLKAVGGGPQGTAPGVDLDKASMGQFRREITRRLGNK